MTKLNRKFSSTRSQLVRLLFTLYVVLSILVTACGGGAPVPSEETTESVTEPTEVSVEVEPTEVIVPVAEPTSIVPSTDKEEKEEEIVEEAAPVVETVAEVLLTVLTGRVDYMLPGTEEWQQALGEEIPLDIGTQLRAYQLSSARLDLLDGSKVLMLSLIHI